MILDLDITGMGEYVKGRVTASKLALFAEVYGFIRLT